MHNIKGRLSNHPKTLARPKDYAIDFPLVSFCLLISKRAALSNEKSLHKNTNPHVLPK